MMPILVKGDDVRSGAKGNASHVRLWLALASMGYKVAIFFVLVVWNFTFKPNHSYINAVM